MIPRRPDQQSDVQRGPYVHLTLAEIRYLHMLMTTIEAGVIAPAEFKNELSSEILDKCKHSIASHPSFREPDGPKPKKADNAD